ASDCPAVLLDVGPTHPMPYPLSLHDALPISGTTPRPRSRPPPIRNSLPSRSTWNEPLTHGLGSGPSYPAGAKWSNRSPLTRPSRSEEHTSELQSLRHLVCRLLLEKKKKDTHA